MSLTSVIAPVIVLWMNTHKNTELSRLSAAGLRARRDRLVAALPRADALLPGALVEQHRNCGKEGCRCTRGEPHGPYVYLQVAGRLVYVPAALAEAVRSRVEISRRLREVLGEISQVNLELLARRELE
jgi:hypothetical protein